MMTNKQTMMTNKQIARIIFEKIKQSGGRNGSLFSEMIGILNEIEDEVNRWLVNDELDQMQNATQR